MAFGKNSNNPRERRAFAHALLAQARTSKEAQDFTRACEAVAAAGDSRKARASRFGQHLLALPDGLTKVIAEAGRRVIDHTQTSILYPLSTQAWQEANAYHPGVRTRVSPGFGWKKGDVSVRASYLIKPGTLQEYGPNSLMITEHSGATISGAHHEIPLAGESIDVNAIRSLPDNTRRHMASLAIQTLIP